MAHTIRDKKKLLDRIRRIRGQVEAIEKALDEEHDCGSTLHTIAACRGALNSLMALMIEGHVREHVLDPTRKPTADQRQAAEELIDTVRTYLR